MTGIERVLIAYPRGFCAGVKRALEIFYGELEYRERTRRGGRLYGYHQIVHNKLVVDDFKRRGVVFVDNIEDVPYRSTVIFSAHGVSPEVWKKAEERQLDVIDATCPLVKRVHKEIVRFVSSGYKIVIIGHADHEEVIGFVGEAPNMTHVVGSIEDVENLPDLEGNVAYVTQTTLNVDDTIGIVKALKARYHLIEEPSGDCVCYATKNRQDAIRTLTREYHPDLFLIFGSANSSNTKRLLEVATASGVKSCRIDDINEVDSSLFEGRRVIGISSGASVPEARILEAINYFKKLEVPDISEVRIVEETITFPVPKDIRRRWSNV